MLEICDTSLFLLCNILGPGKALQNFFAEQIHLRRQAPYQEGAASGAELHKLPPISVAKSPLLNSHLQASHDGSLPWLSLQRSEKVESHASWTQQRRVRTEYPKDRLYLHTKRGSKIPFGMRHISRVCVSFSQQATPPRNPVRS